MQTFGWNLLQFARSIDNLHQAVFDGMKDLVGDHFLSKDGLDACYFCVHRDGAVIDRQDAFKTVWSSESASESHVVRRFSDGTKTSPSLRALAFNDGRCLWVTGVRASEDGRDMPSATLDKAPTGGLKDLWPEDDDEDALPLPPYLSLHDKPCRTLVALPLTQFGQKLGVLVIEFKRWIPCTPGAREEAGLIRAALGRILWLQDAMHAQQEGTRRAFDELKKVAMDSASSVDPPAVFLASPGTSDVEVTQAIKRVVARDYRDILKLISWDEMDDPGQITDQIVDEIARSRYGICYFSEIEPSGDAAEADTPSYIYNRNVLIEAGMLSALRHSRFGPTRAWIPIRENEGHAEGVPFDFVAERMIRVPREDGGRLVVDEFEEMLKDRIEAMLAV